MDGTIGEIRIFAGNFAPRNWELCDGETLQINSNQALYSILGTMYGGDGRTTFSLPDLRGRSPIGAGTAPTLSRVDLGQEVGAEQVTLTEAQMPAHNHTINGSTATGTSSSPANAHWAGLDEGVHGYHSSHDTAMASETAATTGGGQAHENRSPSLGINFIICTVGAYPSRS